MNDQMDLLTEVKRLKGELAKEIEQIDKIDTLVKKQIEREPGIWEYGFDELEAEMWRRFAYLEKNSECLTEEEKFAPDRISGKLARRFKKIYRTISSPFSRTILDKRKQYDLDKQNFRNLESVPFYLSMILTLQKIKDRLNYLEEKTLKIAKDQEELLFEMKEKGSKDDK